MNLFGICVQFVFNLCIFEQQSIVLMAALTFQYRSRKENAPLEARLSYTIDGNRTSLYIRSKIEVQKEFWKEYKKGIQFRDAEKSNLKKEIDDKIFNLQHYVLEKYENSDEGKINKEWLKNVINEYYKPKSQQTKIPSDLIDYWDYYLNLRGRELEEKARSYQKWITVKHKVERFQKKMNQTFLIKDVNEEFKKNFIEYCKDQNYSNHTIKKEFSYIKTICTHARTKEVEVSPELDILKINLKNHSIPKIYLNFHELDRIVNLKDLPENLDIVRDWLIISCYTGQRISDFMRFDATMISKKKGKPVLDIKQVKTQKSVSIPLLPEVIKILDKRNGNFPKKISHQKYNNLVKEVCKQAGLTQIVKGGVRINNRKVIGEYPKWKLVASHIGRRSFATNYYGDTPTGLIRNITGHSTEDVLKAYIGKSSKDTAYEAYDYLLSANKKHNSES